MDAGRLAELLTKIEQIDDLLSRGDAEPLTATEARLLRRAIGTLEQIRAEQEERAGS